MREPAVLPTPKHPDLLPKAGRAPKAKPTKPMEWPDEEVERHRDTRGLGAKEAASSSTGIMDPGAAKRQKVEIKSPESPKAKTMSKRMQPSKDTKVKQVPGGPTVDGKTLTEGIRSGIQRLFRPPATEAA